MYLAILARRDQIKGRDRKGGEVDIKRSSRSMLGRKDREHEGGEPLKWQIN